MKKVTIQRKIAGFILHGAPHMGGIGKNNRRHDSSQLLGLLSLIHCDSNVGFVPSNKLLIGGGLLRHHSDRTSDKFRSTATNVPQVGCAVRLDGILS